MSTPKWDPEYYGRCENCGMRLVHEDQFGDHLGHRIHDVGNLSFWEWFKILVGIL